LYAAPSDRPANFFCFRLNAQAGVSDQKITDDKFG
jgi:hypothetical protein